MTTYEDVLAALKKGITADRDGHTPLLGMEETAKGLANTIDKVFQINHQHFKNSIETDKKIAQLEASIDTKDKRISQLEGQLAAYKAQLEEYWRPF